MRDEIQFGYFIQNRMLSGYAELDRQIKQDQMNEQEAYELKETQNSRDSWRKIALERELQRNKVAEENTLLKKQIEELQRGEKWSNYNG